MLHSFDKFFYCSYLVCSLRDDEKSEAAYKTLGECIPFEGDGAGAGSEEEEEEPPTKKRRGPGRPPSRGGGSGKKGGRGDAKKRGGGAGSKGKGKAKR